MTYHFHYLAIIFGILSMVLTFYVGRCLRANQHTVLSRNFHGEESYIQALSAWMSRSFYLISSGGVIMIASQIMTMSEESDALFGFAVGFFVFVLGMLHAMNGRILLRYCLRAKGRNSLFEKENPHGRA